VLEKNPVIPGPVQHQAAYRPPQQQGCNNLEFGFEPWFAVELILIQWQVFPEITSSHGPAAETGQIPDPWFAGKQHQFTGIEHLWVGSQKISQQRGTAVTDPQQVNDARLFIIHCPVSWIQKRPFFRPVT
jgi:hypothetical protein